MTPTIRVCTLNLWGIQPPLDRRLHLARHQFAALSPDVIGLQEVRPLDGISGRTTACVLAEELGMERVYEVAVKWQAGAFGDGTPAGEEGLAILSRLPILEHRASKLPDARPTESRIVLSACVETAGGPVWVHTTHLHYRLDDGLARERQVLAVDDAVRHIGREVEDPVHIVCGDFNAEPDADEIRFLRGLHTLGGRRTHYQDAWRRHHLSDQGITWSSENEQTRPLHALDIDRRIDYIFVTSRRRDGRGTIHDTRVVLHERDDAGVCASDHYGVLAEVQVAANSAS